MILIETYYLIDYENVGGDGLSGCNKLSKTDHIIIFFTKNAKRIDMSEIADHGEAELEMIEVPAGKQSADIHIGSYAGHLTGINKGRDCSIVIISKDTDFDNVVKLWKEKTGIKLSRAQQIKVSTPKATTAKQTTSTKKTHVKVSGAKKTKLNQEIMQAVREDGFDAQVSNRVAQLVTSLYGKEQLMTEVHNALREQYTNYLEVYKAIKSVLSKYDDSPAATPKKTSVPQKASAPKKTSVPNKSAINTKIMQILSKAGFEQEIVGYCASTAVKNVGVNNGKQQIYRTIISKYGKNKGLNIYNQIKKYI